MKTFKVIVNKMSVMSVWGENEKEARENVESQLNRPENPSRYNAYKAWKAQGSILRDENGNERGA